jgi:hypothetical protein
MIRDRMAGGRAAGMSTTVVGGSDHPEYDRRGIQKLQFAN